MASCLKLLLEQMVATIYIYHAMIKWHEERKYPIYELMRFHGKRTVQFFTTLLIKFFRFSPFSHCF